MEEDVRHQLLARTHSCMQRERGREGGRMEGRERGREREGERKGGRGERERGRGERLTDTERHRDAHRVRQADKKRQRDSWGPCTHIRQWISRIWLSSGVLQIPVERWKLFLHSTVHLWFKVSPWLFQNPALALSGDTKKFHRWPWPRGWTQSHRTTNILKASRLRNHLYLTPSFSTWGNGCPGKGTEERSRR